MAWASKLSRAAGRLADMQSLAGPILEKELRVASRRKRNYILHFAYVSALAMFILLAWPQSFRYASSMAPGGSSAAYMISQMSQAGMEITAGIMWFQFVAVQIVAVMVLSTAVRSEITSRTLGILMTTPISFFKIVLGKLLGKMLQITLLLAISLPVLSLVRVLGGVKLDYVLAGLCITFTAALLVGAMSLYASISSRSAISAMIKCAIWYVLFFRLLPALPMWLAPGVVGMLVRHFAVPSAVFLDVTMKMLQPAGGGTAVYWPIHCAIMLVLTLLVLLLAARKTRREALKSLDGRPTRKNRPGASAGQSNAVSGPAILWKDMRHFFPSTRLKTVLALVAFLAIMSLLYVPCVASGNLREATGQGLFIFLYFGVGCIVTLMMAATGITVEKESRALGVLLTTPISDWSIIQSKAVSVFRRTAAAWAMLVIHLIVFTAAGFVRPMLAVGVVAVSLYMIVLLTGAGLYVSSRVKTSSNATMLSLAICAGLWLVGPIFAVPLRLPSSSLVLLANPFYQIGSIIKTCVYSYGTQWDWAMYGYIGMSFLIYSSIGLLLMGRAKVQMRRRLFC